MAWIELRCSGQIVCGLEINGHMKYSVQDDGVSEQMG